MRFFILPILFALFSTTFAQLVIGSGNSEGVYRILPVDNPALALTHTHVENPDTSPYKTEAVATIAAFQDSADQKWRFRRNTDGTFRIFLDGNESDKSDMALVLYSPNSFAVYESWTLDGASSDRVVFRASRDRCLTFEGAVRNASRLACTGASNQVWRIESVYPSQNLSPQLRSLLGLPTINSNSGPSAISLTPEQAKSLLGLPLTSGSTYRITREQARSLFGQYLPNNNFNQGFLLNIANPSGIQGRSIFTPNTLFIPNTQFTPNTIFTPTNTFQQQPLVWQQPLVQGRSIFQPQFQPGFQNGQFFVQPQGRSLNFQPQFNSNPIQGRSFFQPTQTRQFVNVQQPQTRFQTRPFVRTQVQPQGRTIFVQPNTQGQRRFVQQPGNQVFVQPSRQQFVI